MQPSNPNQFTERAWAAIATTTDLAKQWQHQQIETEHLMLALLDEDGLASRILQKAGARSEEHTSELQSPVPISYAVFCLKKKNINIKKNIYINDNK